MFVKFGDVIINLEYVSDIHHKKEFVEIYLVNEKKYTLHIDGAEELEEFLADYNETRGYKHD